MTDHAAFLAAIIAKPDDDLPRLIYADYLDERGEAERAEFIRVQIELSKEGEFKTHGHNFCAQVNPGCWHCFVGPALRRLERELLAGYTAADNKGGRLPHTSAWAGEAWRFHERALYRRGFVEEITCSWDDWRTHADTIRASTPLRKVKLTTIPNDGNRFFEMHVLNAVERTLLIQSYPGIEFELPQPRYENRTIRFRVSPGTNLDGPVGEYAPGTLTIVR